MRESTFTLVYWGFIPSFPTKGQPDKLLHTTNSIQALFPWTQKETSWGQVCRTWWKIAHLRLEIFFRNRESNIVKTMSHSNRFLQDDFEIPFPDQSCLIDGSTSNFGCVKRNPDLTWNYFFVDVILKVPFRAKTTWMAQKWRYKRFQDQTFWYDFKLTWLAGKSAFLIVDTSSNGCFSIVIFVFGGQQISHAEVQETPADSPR